MDVVDLAVDAITAGRAVIVVDDDDRGNAGHVVLAAELVTAEQIAFLMRECRGVIRVPVIRETIERLDLPQIALTNSEHVSTAFTTSVDARLGVDTGVAAADRAYTIRLLADPDTMPDDLTRPGHVYPVEAQSGGVLQRAAHAEAAVDLCRLAGLAPAAVVCEVANDDGSVARLPELEAFGLRHGLPVVSITGLIELRQRSDRQVERVTSARMPLEAGLFEGVGYRSLLDGREHVALVMGEIGDGEDVLVRIHSECLTGDALGSHRCDCRTQLQLSLEAVAGEQRGVVVYLRGQEGRDVSLLRKLQAYRLQDEGDDTLELSLRQGPAVDGREYGIAAQILVDLGVRTIRLMTNNPMKAVGVEGFGLKVLDRVPVAAASTPHNLRYLRAKRDVMGHDLPGLPWYDEDADWGSVERRTAWERPRVVDPQDLFGLEPSIYDED